MSRLAELLVEWEERWEAGAAVSAEDLCKHEPWLLAALAQRIAQLQRFRDIEEPACLPRTPARVGSYAVKQVLGAGATGIVYLAKDRTLRRKVAVKVLSPQLALISAEDRLRLAERFRREARLVAKLCHPAIVPIYEAELDAGDPYFVMEYLAGGSLQDRLRAAPGKPAGTCAEVAAFMDPVVQAISHAHANGVVHRDLKPGNILLQRKSETRNPKSEINSKSEVESAKGQTGAGSNLGDFEPKVTDFGLAKLIDDTLWHDDSSAMSGDRRTLAADPLLTQLGRQPGTPAYMAPEQFDGSVGLVGLPADIWALGVIFYELMTGRRPFPAEHRDELRQQICNERLLPPRAHQPRIDAALERLTLRCLDRDPARRPRAVELAGDLDRYLRPGPVRRFASAALGIWHPVWIVLARRG